ncbi:DUF1330 domain-containing protein [Litoribrevibacter albus]|uniref:DUF1330 domain-containing protein n=1 Tax=Litoribrevibacter albus TaxID=1473156 RepID=A0AA37SCW0_9GAMM|nr:DUF1330 domain-containing protein [Litoribrevibacter albus]GLQ32753.1 hypothetical protein GCM10007876_32320 [Litoribrevibacter albus]
MAYEIHVGVRVEDEAGYQAYREGMYPILQKYQGDFVFDLSVDKLLKSPLEEAVNRVFIIRFCDQAKKEAFFSDPEYLAVRQQYFEPSVGYSAMLRAYDVESGIEG